MAKDRTERPSDGDARRRLLAARDAAVEELRQLGTAPPPEDAAPRTATKSVLDVGDVAQASERLDLAFARRARLAARINTLTTALERIQEGTYGWCRVCGGAIESERLVAMPEADTCRGCQERIERGSGRETAA